MRDRLLCLGITFAFALVCYLICIGIGQITGRYVEPYSGIAVAALFFAITANFDSIRTRRTIINMRKEIRKQRNKQTDYKSRNQ